MNVTKQNYLTRSGLLEDVELFNHYKQKAQEFIDSDFDNENFDVALKDIIITLNQIEGIATRFSCTGHKDEDAHPQLGIHLVVHTPEALDRLKEIIYNYNKQLTPDHNEFNFIFHDEFNFSLHLEYMGTLCDFDEKPTWYMYPSVTIRNFWGEFTDEFYLKKLLDCINSN